MFKRIIGLTALVILFQPIFCQLTESFKDIGFTEHLDEYIPDSVILLDEHQKPVNLKEIIDKPTVISFVYFRCPGICTPLLNSLSELIDASDMLIGDDYQVITISFDPAENPELAKQKKHNLVSRMAKKDVAEKGWLFFTADSSNIGLITNSVGFHYKKRANDYIHTGGMVVLSPEGKITRYLNGIDFLPFELKMSIVEASKGQSGPAINKLLSYCFAYDQQSNQYVIDITKISGALILFLAVALFLFLVIKQVSKKKKLTSTN